MYRHPTPLVLLLLALGAALAPAWAQERIYRCGNEYTNNPSPSQKGRCHPVTGGNVTVVPSQRPAAPARAAVSAPQKADAEQRQRDAEARAILESELQKAEARRADLLQEYNNGEPERLGSERNYQKYLDRVAGLKASIERADNDIAGLRRELGRLAAPGK